MTIISHRIVRRKYILLHGAFTAVCTLGVHAYARAQLSIPSSSAGSSKIKAHRSRTVKTPAETRSRYQLECPCNVCMQSTSNTIQPPSSEDAGHTTRTPIPPTDLLTYILSSRTLPSPGLVHVAKTSENRGHCHTGTEVPIHRTRGTWDRRGPMHMR